MRKPELPETPAPSPTGARWGGGAQCSPDTGPSLERWPEADIPARPLSRGAGVGVGVGVGAGAISTLLGIPEAHAG